MMLRTVLGFFIFITGKNTNALVDAGCTFSGITYEVGQTWHPILQPFGATPCVNCSCQLGGEVSCKSETDDCPKPDCSSPIMTGCCPVCEVKTEDNVDRKEKAKCEADGKKYKDGDSFPSTTTGIVPNAEDQCVMCVCTEGRVLCRLKTCAVVANCRRFVNTSDDCCPQCADCVDVTGLKRNGSTWHPTVGPFGDQMHEMKCIFCKCLNGEIDCKRRQCGPSENTQCPDPEDKRCCKSCQQNGHKNRRKKKKCKRRKDRNGKRRGRCKERKKKGETTNSDTLQSTLPPLINQTVQGTQEGDIFQKYCIRLPDRADKLVYRSRDAKYVFLAFDEVRKDSVEVLRWSIQRGRLSNMQTEHYQATIFRTIIEKDQILGTTTKRNYKKFKRRLERKLQHCKSSCRLKSLLRVLNRLRMRNVRFEADCEN